MSGFSLLWSYHKVEVSQPFSRQKEKQTGHAIQSVAGYYLLINHNYDPMLRSLDDWFFVSCDHATNWYLTFFARATNQPTVSFESPSYPAAQ
jgi:hypothetical protein